MDVLLLMLGVAWGREKLGARTVGYLGVGLLTTLYGFLAATALYGAFTTHALSLW